jgi:hypothetical protein
MRYPSNWFMLQDPFTEHWCMHQDLVHSVVKVMPVCRVVDTSGCQIGALCLRCVWWVRRKSGSYGILWPCRVPVFLEDSGSLVSFLSVYDIFQKTSAEGYVRAYLFAFEDRS